MSEALYGIAIWIVVAWPLVLALPALRSHLPWPRHLAVLPAAALMVLPSDGFLELPRLLFGIGLAVDSETRWILAMSLAVWFTAATVIKSSRHDPADERAITFFLLTLAGNLGAVLSADLVGFFSFSTLMGYGFYALLIQGGDEQSRRAGRLYVIFLVLADLALFEALLLAASNTENLRYEVVRQAMAGTSSSQFFITIALVGFALKAGIWPAHLWLLAAFKTVPRSAASLLGGVPVAMGLLGAVRWLPLGESTFDVLGTTLQVIGVAAMLYALLRLFTHTCVKMLPAWVTVAATGLFIAALGTGLAYPAIWHQYEYLTYPFIALLGVFLAALTFAIGRLQGTRQPPAIALPRVEFLGLPAGRGIALMQRWAKDRLLGLQSLWRASWLKATKRYQRILDWHKPGFLVGTWSVSITMFVLLGMALAWLAG